MAKNIVETSDENFESDVLKSDIPVLVDFWAPWCGPCKAIGPVIEKLSEFYGEKVKFVKCNVDDHKEKASNYGVNAIPTLIFFKDGENKNQITGLASEAKIREKIDALL